MKEIPEEIYAWSRIKVERRERILPPEGELPEKENYILVEASGGLDLDTKLIRKVGWKSDITDEDIAKVKADLHGEIRRTMWDYLQHLVKGTVPVVKTYIEDEKVVNEKKT